MPVIRLPNSTYNRLQSHATPFTDTPATVIDRLLDNYEGNSDSRSTDKSVQQTIRETDDLLLMDPYSPGDLRYTKVQIASFGNRDVEGPRGPNWNRLLMVAHEVALMKFGSFEKLSQLTDTNVQQGKYTSDGYHYNADYNFSMQNKRSNEAWQDSFKIARKLDLPVIIMFEWPQKEEAAYPGRTALIQWPEDVIEEETV